ncbi:hypothetical protein [Salmonella enterica]|uniref:hypothetical protein n=1 Tax=Salmonella enterica TaxID=28901 RepID=UPI0006B9246D|nr:hypothetical protein [Salmonella enterica]ALE65251.1 hypothetical protein SE15cs_05004 [Salmonella enterica subsp. enterica serovar Typhimurium]
MIYKDITILYIDSGKNNRLIRYDLLRKENNDFVVQVFDDQNEDIADPKPTIKIDQFEITYDNYLDNCKHSNKLPDSFEEYVDIKLQDHRDKLD